MQKVIEKAAVLIEALPYIQSFKDKVVVVKYGGSAMVDNEHAQGVIRDVVFMAAVGMKPIIVHGGGSRITAAMREKGKQAEFVEGMRVTDEESMQIVKEVLLEVNKEIVDVIESFGGKGACVLNDINAVKHYVVKDNAGVQEKIDIGYVGDIDSVKSDQIKAELAKGVIPVIPPVGVGIDDKHDYNINADLSASAVAMGLKAEKLVFITDVPGIMSDPSDESSLMATLKPDDVDNLIEKGVISGGMLPKIKAGLRAVEAGVHKTHIIDGRLLHSLLLEIFTDKGVGTQISND